MQKIKEEVLNLIRYSKICKAKLQIGLDKSAPTIQNYLDDNNIMLTTATALNIIGLEFGLTDEEILTDGTLESELLESDVQQSKK